MITFFRRIRKGLLDGGNTSRYLVYAIGEIVLVVIGILIALQINNWNEGEKSKRELFYSLQTIKSNLSSDILNINQELNDGNSQMEFWTSLLNNTDNGLSFNSLPATIPISLLLSFSDKRLFDSHFIPNTENSYVILSKSRPLSVR